MNTFFELFPALIFLFVFYKYDIYAATVVLLISTFIQNAVYWAQHKKFNKMYLITFILTAVFGGATLFFHDPDFLKWKPTIVNLVFSVALLIYPLFAKKSIIEQMMGSQLKLPSAVWNNLNLAWALFFVFMAALNYYVAFHYGANTLTEEQRLDVWVKLKAIGSPVLTLIFTFGQMFFIYKHIQPKENEDNNTTN